MKTTTDKVWMVRDNNIITLYHNKADAYRHYYDLCVYYNTHSEPSPNDLWSYAVSFVWKTRNGDPYDCTHYLATWQDKEMNFYVSVLEKEILNNYEP